ncbi:MAG TPA: xanthine dehydrogenase family protein subunit M [Thermomicrobiales bacterium]|nr:carbon monoxide dehydrogenase [Chloroflexota bacterium]HQZ89833.1 xanthine dehydrogenase family protein subunit M [Thermomicrobiales bacterium]
MYPRAFDYKRVSTVQEAIDALKDNPDAKLLSGGHSLLPAMKLRLASPDLLVDIGRVAELRNIAVNGSATIGAGVTYNDFLNNDAMKPYTALYDAVSSVGDVQVRNRGTIGGAAAHADPAADVPAALLVLGATFVAQGPNGQREISADDFFVDILTTALEPDEVLTQIRLPAAAGASAYEKFAHPASGYAVCGVAASINGNDVKVALTGATYRATRLTGVEDALKSGAIDAAAIEQAVKNVGDQDWAGDHFASSEYRAHLAQVYAKRALMRAAGLS